MDNDCDGFVDNENPPGAPPLCAPGKKCVSGPDIGCQCAEPCSAGEFPCPDGGQCETLGKQGRFCVFVPVCADGKPCPTGICADGVCCNRTCTGRCEACSAAHKHGGVDGVCEPIAGHPDTDDECLPCTSNLDCRAGEACQPDGICGPAVAEGPTSGCAWSPSGGAGAAGALAALVVVGAARRRRRAQRV
jgi:MYXO-CTERM domain-containing protein